MSEQESIPEGMKEIILLVTEQDFDDIVAAVAQYMSSRRFIRDEPTLPVPDQFKGHVVEQFQKSIGAIIAQMARDTIERSGA